MKRFIAVLALVGATVVGGLAVASPAQAGPAQEHYAISTVDGPAYDHWFWVDNGDLQTKRALTVVMFFFTLAETNADEKLPLITIPAQ